MDIPFDDPENIEDPAMREIIGEYRRAVDAGDLVAQGESLLHLGTLYAIREQFATAIKYYNEALSIQRDIGDADGQSKSLSNIGLAKADLGNYQDAINYHLEALEISRVTENEVAESNHLVNLAETYEYLKQYDEAIQCLEEVKTVYEQMDVPHLLRKASLNKERLESMRGTEKAKRSTATYPSINSKLQLDTYTENKQESSSDKTIVNANLKSMHKLPNDALETVHSIMRDTGEMNETQVNPLKHRAEPSKEDIPEAENTAIIPNIDDKVLFEQSEEGEFGVDTDPVDTPTIPGRRTQRENELNLADAEDTDEFVAIELKADDPDLSSNVRMNFILQAIKDMKYELSIAEAIGELGKKGDYLMRLAALYMKLHQYDNAIAHYEEALVLFGVLGKNYFREEAERGILEARDQKWSRN